MLLVLNVLIYYYSQRFLGPFVHKGLLTSEFYGGPLS